MIPSKTFSAAVYVKRRAALKAVVGSGQILLLGNDHSSINFEHNTYYFRQDSTFLYYFGLSQPGLMGVIDCESGVDTLVGDDLSIDSIIWTGQQPKLSQLAENVGVSEVSRRDKVRTLLKQDVHYLPPYRDAHTLQYMELFADHRDSVRKGVSIPLIKAVASQRNIKSKEEIDEINIAVKITCAMHQAVMESARAGMKECELVGVAAKVAHEHDANFSFPPILTVNGQVLHNHDHGNLLEEGHMVLFDTGAESPLHYAGDMTRTFPVSKAFDSRQKELYDVVYSSQSAAAEGLAAGVEFRTLHWLAAEKIVDGLCQVGLMQGDPKEAVAVGAHTLFFQCGLGHMMGLDVHDMENLGEKYVGYTPEMQKSTAFGLKSLRLGKSLEVGNVVTVEPGIYMIPELMDLFRANRKFESFINYSKLESFRDFGGIRIEDDYVITEDGGQRLGPPLESASHEIEELRRQVLSAH